MENSGCLQNDPGSVRFRRNSNTLTILGAGVSIYGFWGIIKLFTQIALGIRIFDEADEEMLGDIGMIIAMSVLVILMAFDVLLRLFVGLRARREGQGRKVGISYLIFDVWLMTGSVASVYLVISTILDGSGDFFDNYVALFMELSSLVVCLEVFIAAISVRRYRSKMKKGSN